jgi:hypothetical protein
MRYLVNFDCWSARNGLRCSFPGQWARRVALPFFTVAFIVMLFLTCAAFLPASAPQAVFPVINEKIYVYPVIDSSSIESFQGWPSEKPLQDILLDNFRKMHRAMVIELRQREKYGLYEIVEDSLLANVRLSFVINRFQLTKDTLTFPVHMTVQRMTDKTRGEFSIKSSGKYRAKSRPKSDVHYLDILLADFRRNFPYRKISGLFYRH